MELRLRVWYNPNLESRRFNLPGLLGLILQNVTVILTAFALVREKERGTLEQLLVTPARPLEIVLGKLVPYVFLGLGAFSAVLALTVLWFGVQPSGSLLLLFLLSLLFLFCAMGMGILISTIAQNQVQAMQLSQFMIMPAFLLSGFIFPREAMPPVLYALGYLFPITYFLLILRGVMVKGAGWSELWPQALALAGFGCLFLLLAGWRFRKTLAASKTTYDYQS